jgi:hypothetical protein
MGKFLSVVSLITTALYFVTSSDSGSLVVDLIAANGREAHVVQRVFWALTEGAVAISLLQAGGKDSVKALQALSICAGLPFTIILMYICTSLWRALKIDQGHLLPREQRTDWSLPLYAGIFDIFETVLSFGKAPLPAAVHAKNFVLGLACPPLLLWKTLRGVSEQMRAAKEADIVVAEKPAEKVEDPAEDAGSAMNEKPGTTLEDSEKEASSVMKGKPTTTLEDLLLVIGASLCYLAFVIFHILAGTKEGDLTGMFAFGWVSLVFFSVIVATVRYNQRAFYRIEGNIAEDFFAALFFWPQVLAQMVYQIESPKSLLHPAKEEA